MIYLCTNETVELGYSPLADGRSACYSFYNLKFKRKETIFEPPHDKTNKMACAPSEDSDQPGHPPSLIRVFAVRSVGSKRHKLPSCESKDSDQTGRMARLVWVFVGRTCHFVGFVMRWLILARLFFYDQQNEWFGLSTWCTKSFLKEYIEDVTRVLMYYWIY